MSRVININDPTKARNSYLRSIAELLRHLAEKRELDQESKDMSAAIVYLLRATYANVDKSVKAWEKRGYWMKADRFLRQWEWTKEYAANFEDVIRNEAWDLIPRLLGELMPHLDQVSVKTFTRSPSTWRGAHQKLLAEPPSDRPW
ncbi:MAG: hypothetical protein R3300_19905 [Candidatus Promineifilaceae bacterium]|nr:hypothetical protein [Candidatus Promineifilaceae bacterium]